MGEAVSCDAWMGGSGHLMSLGCAGEINVVLRTLFDRMCGRSSGDLLGVAERPAVPRKRPVDCGIHVADRQQFLRTQTCSRSDFFIGGMTVVPFRRSIALGRVLPQSSPDRAREKDGERVAQSEVDYSQNVGR